MEVKREGKVWGGEEGGGGRKDVEVRREEGERGKKGGKVQGEGGGGVAE